MESQKQYTVNVREALARLLKYFMEGLVVGLAIWMLPQNSHIAVSDGLVIATTAMATFAILDFLSPTMGSYARIGAGASIGSQMVGGIPTGNDKYKHRNLF